MDTTLTWRQVFILGEAAEAGFILRNGKIRHIPNGVFRSLVTKGYLRERNGDKYELTADGYLAIRHYLED